MKQIVSKVSVVVLIAVCALFARVTVDLPTRAVDVQQVGGNALFTAQTFVGKPGEPALPGYNCNVLLPANTDLQTVTYSIEGLVEAELAGEFNVEAVEPYRNVLGWESFDGARNVVDGRISSIYTTDALFPAQHVKAGEVAQMNSFKLASVSVNLYRYNPVTKKLYQMVEGKLVVDYKVDPAYAPRKSVRIPREVQGRLNRMVVNADEFMSQYENDFTFVNEDLQVIAIPEALKGQLKNLDAYVEAKQKKNNIKVKVITESTWGGGTGEAAYNNLRKWLQDNYQEMGINYFFIIGSSALKTSNVPMHYFPNYANWGPNYPDEHDHCESDWGYCQLNGDYKSDKVPELHVGRIPNYNNPAQIDAILEKTIKYMTTEEKDGAWRYNALFGGPGYDSRNTSWKALNQAYSEYIETNPQWKAYRCYSSMYGTPVGADKVSSDMSGPWSEGSYSVISWGAHGSTTSAQGAFNSSKTTVVGNEYPGFVMCGSCSNATISSSNNLSYAILKNCGMGAIGGTDYTVVMGDMIWIRKYVKYLVTDKMTIGATQTELINNDCITPWLNRAPYVLYGDPSIGVYTFAQPQNTQGTINLARMQMGVQNLPGKAVNFTFTGLTKDASLAIYSLSGAKVATVNIKAGTTSFAWDRTNAYGKKVGNGLYVARLNVNNNVMATQSKLVLK